MAQFSEIQADTSNLPCWLLSSHCFAVTTLSVPLPSVGAVSVKHGPNHCVTVKVSNSISAVGLCLSADFNYHASASIYDQKQTGNCSVMSYELEK